MPQYLFSHFRANEFESLHRELSKVLDIEKAKLQSLYQVMRSEFDADASPTEHTLPRTIFRSADPNYQKRYDESLIIGVDLPCVLESNDGAREKKTAVILAQDPLRKSSQRREEIAVGTPYTVHRKSDREKGRSSAYFALIRVLLDEGYRVYLTDIFKIWVSQPYNDQCSPLPRQDCDRFTQVLRTELGIFAPLAVITWGQKAADTLNSFDLGIRHLGFPHPSGAANGKWYELMGQSPTRENKIGFWRQKVLGYLARQI